MAERVILHIGSMKSGTSFIQNVLGNNREALATHGISFAGRKWREQVKAVQDITHHGGADQPPLDPKGDWLKLARKINKTPGTSVISMEFLAPRLTPKIELMRDSFDGEVEVVLTGRDLARNAAAMWLESVQNRWTVDWDDYLEAIRSEDPTNPASRAFWNHQGLAKIARRWSDVVGADRFTLLTVPPKGAPSGLLWERFAQVLRLDPQAFELNVRANPSIGLATAITLRELNERLEAAHHDGAMGEERRYLDLLVKHLLVKRSLAGRQRDEPKLAVDQRWLLKRGAAEVDRLREQGHRVLGDLDELKPVKVPGVHPSDVKAETLHRATMEALSQMVQVAVQREDMHRTRQSDMRQEIKQLVVESASEVNES